MTSIDVREADGGVVLTPSGRLTVVTAPLLRTAIAERISTGSRLIIIDLSSTDFVDSSGLGALVSCLKSARQAGGDLRLVAPTEQLSMVLRMTNLDRILQPRASVDDALLG